MLSHETIQSGRNMNEQFLAIVQKDSRFSRCSDLFYCFQISPTILQASELLSEIPLVLGQSKKKIKMR
uniref:Uncharacterized protein n=1 Tax=Onchocerca volvulus TaxID=6282 RepID=A0A8R1XZK7_ONCVO